MSVELTAYNETLRWKYEGPSNSFKALVDMAAVHSSCRLCIHLATIIRAEEETAMAAAVAERPCKCTDSSDIVTYHLYVRERGKFEFESVFVRSNDLSVAGLEAAVLAKFSSLNYVPVWYSERPVKIRGDGTLRIHKLYPVGLTQRDALYSVYFHNDDNVKGHLEDNPCPKLEVIFV
jgi:glycoprotein 3-alpha-L-fucosyltransferase